MKRFALLLFALASAAAAQNRFPPINLYDGDPSGAVCTIDNSIVQSTTTGAIASCLSGVYVITGGGPLGAFVPLAGGTMTGALNGTAATFSGTVTGTTVTGTTVTGPMAVFQQAQTFTSTPQAQTSYGDSNTFGTGTTDRNLSWVYRIANHYGYGMAGVTNRGVNGAMACDVSELQLFPNDTPTAVTPHRLYTFQAGTNEAGQKGAGTYEATYNACANAVITYLSIPSTSKVMGSTMVAGSTGTCILDTHYAAAGNQGISCTASGSTASASIAVTGGTLYIWSRAIDGNAGTWTYSVKNSLNVVVASGTVTTALARAIATSNGTTQATVLAARVTGLPSDTYTTTFAQTHAGTMAIVGIGTTPTGTYQVQPFVWVSDIPNRLDGAVQSDTDAYRADITADVKQAQAESLSPVLAPISKYIAMTTAANDVYPDGFGVHYNNQGNLEAYNGWMAPIKAPGGWQEVTTIVPNMLPDPLFSNSPSQWSIHDSTITIKPNSAANGVNAMVYTSLGGASPGTAFVNSAAFTVAAGQVLYVRAYVDATNVSAGNPSVRLVDADTNARLATLAQFQGKAGYLSAAITVPGGTANAFMQLNAIGTTETIGQTITFSDVCVAAQYSTYQALCSPVGVSSSGGSASTAVNSPSNIAGANIVTNGTFEAGSGTIGTGWGTFCDAGGGCTYLRDTTTPHSGTYSQKMSMTGSSGTQEVQLHQLTLTYALGTQYLISFWARNDGSAIGMNYFLTDSGSTKQCAVVPITLTSTWTFYSSTCTATVATAANGGLYFNATGADGAVWIDDVSIVSLTPPTYPGFGAASQLGVTGTGTKVCTGTGVYTSGNIITADANSNCVDSGTALSSLTPASAVAMWGQVSSGSTFTTTAGAMKITRIIVPSPGVTFSNIAVKTGATTDGVNASSFAIYKNDGSVVYAHTAAQVFGSASTNVAIATVEGAVTLQPGLYVIGTASASGTQTFIATAPFGTTFCGGSGTAPTAGQTPNTTSVGAGVATLACASTPAFLLY